MTIERIGNKIYINTQPTTIVTVKGYTAILKKIIAFLTCSSSDLLHYKGFWFKKQSAISYIKSQDPTWFGSSKAEIIKKLEGLFKSQHPSALSSTKNETSLSHISSSHHISSVQPTQKKSDDFFYYTIVDNLKSPTNFSALDSELQKRFGKNSQQIPMADISKHQNEPCIVFVKAMLSRLDEMVGPHGWASELMKQQNVQVVLFMLRGAGGSPIVFMSEMDKRKDLDVNERWIVKWYNDDKGSTINKADLDDAMDQLHGRVKAANQSVQPTTQSTAKPKPNVGKTTKAAAIQNNSNTPKADFYYSFVSQDGTATSFKEEHIKVVEDELKKKFPHKNILRVPYGSYVNKTNSPYFVIVQNCCSGLNEMLQNNEYSPKGWVYKDLQNNKNVNFILLLQKGLYHKSTVKQDLSEFPVDVDNKWLFSHHDFGVMKPEDLKDVIDGIKSKLP